MCSLASHAIVVVHVPSKCDPVACAHSMIGANAVTRHTSILVRISDLHAKRINRYPQMLATGFSVHSSARAVPAHHVLRNRTDLLRAEPPKKLTPFCVELRPLGAQCPHVQLPPSRPPPPSHLSPSGTHKSTAFPLPFSLFPFFPVAVSEIPPVYSVGHPPGLYPAPLPPPPSPLIFRILMKTSRLPLLT